jgi:5'-nucleotidase (lipoprotein e(P4) family)
MLKLKAVVFGLLFTVIFSPAFADENATSPNYKADKWYRDSSERNAIYREVFMLAENVIKQKVATEKLQPKQWGVILDIDETILDNSQWFYQRDVQGDKSSSSDFAATAVSVATPGAKRFLEDIHKMGGYVNLVSNRNGTLQAATEKNLRKQGLYFDQVLLDTSNSNSVLTSKDPRFEAIMNGTAPAKLPAQKIVAWLGDNIQDFYKLKQTDMIKQNPNGNAYKAFGVTFFALPNPMYGSWEINRFK